MSSQKITNDFKILFTLLCISYGAGMRFVEMLNHIGLTVSWKKAMQVLDERMVKMKEQVKKFTPSDIAIIVLMDNIKIYKGKRKHLRIFNELTPSMWNFTGRAFIIPYISDDVKKQMQNKEEMCQSQIVLKIDHRDILYNGKSKEDQLAKAIISSGFNVNKKEGCGLTPLHLAIMSSNVNMVHFLIERNAKFNGPMFSSIPSPKSIAERLN